MTPAEATLGKWAQRMDTRFRLLGWEGLITEARGRSHMADGVGRLPHKAARLLDHIRRRGVGVVMQTPPWTRAQVDQAAARGSHKSANDHTEFVCQELIEFCEQGYWIVLPLATVQDLTRLRLSPLGVVPQRERRPRLIVDYTFSNVNQETVRLAPPEAMQFGRALQRIVTNLVHADPRYGPPHMAKIDIADGFYRVWIRAADVPTLGVVLPRSDDAPMTLVAFPLALPMGWVESPPFFTTLTETACDLTNRAIRSPHEQLPLAHRLEGVSCTPPADHAKVSIPRTWAAANTQFTGTGPSWPLATADVYVDDFLLTAQTKRFQSRLMRHALTSIDHVLRPLDTQDPVHRKEPISVKKLAQGDAAWSTQKRMLGWDLDTVAGTLALPPHRLERLRAILDRVQPPRKRLPTSEWHQILGELRSMSAALPGSRGLFSILQDTLSKGDRHRIRLNRHVFDVISDFRFLLDSLAARPTRLREMVPVAPSDTGACDACRIGMGGVWFDALENSSPPIVWRAKFPLSVQQSLVTAEHPRGTISISDLELAGTIAHKDVLANARHVHERTMWVAGDNQASLSWAIKGSATSSRARAYLLRLNALHQRAHRYVARHHHIPGALNSMADDASPHLLATAPAAAAYAIGTDWCAIQSTMHSRFSAQRDSAFHTTWRLWTAFCSELGLDAPLRSVPGDKVPLLQLFAHRYRHGILTTRSRLVRSRTVEDAVRSVGQTFSRMGSPDPRLNQFGVVDIRLSTLFQAWKKADSPPARVKPLPMGIVRGAVQLAHAAATPLALAAADCLTIAFYFLLRPGEYAGSPRTAADDLFRLQDVGLWIGGRQLSIADCPLPDLQAATFGTLLFTSQKNGIRGETIGHARSGHPTLCPVLCLISRVTYLRLHDAGPTIPLNATRSPRTAAWQYLQPAIITGFLRSAVVLAPDLGICPSDISARSTRAGGAMAMMCAGIDCDRIRLIGRWRSDEMYRYLHVQAQPVMNGVAAAMFRGGHYRLTPGELPTPLAPPP